MGKDLNKLFLMLNDNEPYSGEEDLFGSPSGFQQPSARAYNRADIELIADFYSVRFNSGVLENTARRFYELNAEAFTAFIKAWMSELPIEAEMLAFGRKILAARDRREAEIAAADYGNNEARAVLGAALKVQNEIHRMYGLLRFSPGAEGEYIARCAPDFLILPALGEYFNARFGETPWVIIDEKRGLVLSRLDTETASLRRAEIQIIDAPVAEKLKCGADEWEDLWRHYHKTVNNESRNNPGLQRQFMPKRYWKYLPEV